MHHLSLGSDWPSAGKYGGCTTYAFSKYLHYSLHPPSSDKVKFNPNCILHRLTFNFDLNHAMEHANIRYNTPTMTE